MSGPEATGRIVGPDGRSKAYRPLPDAARAAALHLGLDAYETGDFFLAHELLEPAWMGAADAGERAFLQGLIKLAAADVHGVRGNPKGVTRNLEGALERLRQAADADVSTPEDVDLPALVADLERRLEIARQGVPTEPTTIRGTDA